MAHAHDRDDTVRPKAALISSLDEKYVANAIAFAALHAAATFLLDGAALRGPDGTLDRAAIRARIEAFTWFAPEMRQRLRRAPLGVSAPMWVPASELDMTYHVRFRTGVHPDEPGAADLLAGRRSAPLDIGRPLWDFEFIELDSGRVALVIRYHHVVGDAMFGMRVGEILTAEQPTAASPAHGAEQVVALGRAPRTGWGTLAVVYRTWRTQHASLGDAWRAYRRKPLRKRARRWAGRLARPVKDLYIARTGMAERVIGNRSSAYAVVDGALVRATARRLGGSVNDLTVAAALRAAARQRSSDATVSMLVPISRRQSDAERNAVSVVKVTVATDATLAETVTQVKDQVRAAVRDGGSRLADGPKAVGYATSITWGRVRRYLGPAAVDVVVGWPAGDPRDEIACLVCGYGSDYAVSLTVRDTYDVNLFMQTISESVATSDSSDATEVAA